MKIKKKVSSKLVQLPETIASKYYRFHILLLVVMVVVVAVAVVVTVVDFL